MRVSKRYYVDLHQHFAKKKMASFFPSIFYAVALLDSSS